MKTEEAKQLARKAIDELALALDDGHSESLTAYLAAMGRFHRYSLSNQILIAAQRPDATQVAGFHTWRKFGRNVRAGERGIAILAPVIAQRRIPVTTISTKPENQAERERPDDQTPTPVAFRAAYVFDIAQTEGTPLPEFAEVRGEPGAYLDRLKNLVQSDGIRIEISKDLGSAKGVSTGGKILLKDGLSPANHFRILAHEFAHEQLHQKANRDSTSLNVRELEADAVAYVVCQAIGLDGTACCDYIQLYDGNKNTLLTRLERIHKTSTLIISRLITKTDAEGEFTKSAQRQRVPPSVQEPDVVAA